MNHECSSATCNACIRFSGGARALRASESRGWIHPFPIVSVTAIHLIQRVCDQMEHLINPRAPDPVRQSCADCQYGANVNGSQSQKGRDKAMKAGSDRCYRASGAAHIKQGHCYQSVMDVLETHLGILVWNVSPPLTGHTYTIIRSVLATRTLFTHVLSINNCLGRAAIWPSIGGCYSAALLFTSTLQWHISYMTLHNS